jgi:hypothetical protein
MTLDTARRIRSLTLTRFGNDPAMGINHRKMEADRKARAEQEVAARRASDAQVLVRMPSA